MITMYNDTTTIKIGMSLNSWSLNDRLKDSLTGIGFDVTEYKTGPALVEALDKVNIVLFEPAGVTNLDIFELVKKSKRVELIAVVFTTNKNYINTIIQSGVDFVVINPTTVSTVVNTISSIITNAIKHHDIVWEKGRKNKRKFSIDDKDEVAVTDSFITSDPEEEVRKFIDERSELAMREFISDTLKSFGVKCSSKGFDYIIDAVILKIKDPANNAQMCKQLYCNIAKKYNTKFTRIERYIRTCIEGIQDSVTCFERMSKTIKWYNGDNPSKKGVSTNTEFLSLMTDYVSKEFSVLR